MVFASGERAPAVVVGPVGTATPYMKKIKESGVVQLEGWDIRRRSRLADQHLKPR